MSIRELYQDLILDHGRSPRNLRPLEGDHREAEGNNPLCGDQLTVYVQLEDDRVADVSFTGEGCAISQASASMMTEQVKGLSRDEAEALAERFHDLVAGEEALPDPDELGKISVLAGVKDYPTRVKCATLAWHTLKAALEGWDDVVTTED